MRSNLAIVQNDFSEDDHMFRTHATRLRGVLNEMQAREGHLKALRVFNSIVSHFTTMERCGLSLNPPTEGWGGAIWSHLLAMSMWKSHEAAVAEAQRIRDGFCDWEAFRATLDEGASR